MYLTTVVTQLHSILCMYAGMHVGWHGTLGENTGCVPVAKKNLVDTWKKANVRISVAGFISAAPMISASRNTTTWKMRESSVISLMTAWKRTQAVKRFLSQSRAKVSFVRLNVSLWSLDSMPGMRLSRHAEKFMKSTSSLPANISERLGEKGHKGSGKSLESSASKKRYARISRWLCSVNRQRCCSD